MFGTKPDDDGESNASGQSRRSVLAALGAGSIALGVGSGTVGASRGRSDWGDSERGRGRRGENTVASRFRELSRGTEWQRQSADTVDFDTHHPQGMTRVGDHFFVSSVEVTEPTRPTEDPDAEYDRTPGAGVGHLFKFTQAGELVGSTTLGEDIVYHPGGIDYDGQHIWVPVAEYRPDSNSIVYRLDPETLAATAVFRYPDHLGALVHNTDANTLHGVSWGSRRFYSWRLSPWGSVVGRNRPPEQLATDNPSHYVDYQDAQYLGDDLLLAAGLATYQPPDGPEFALGGIDLVDLDAEQPVHQVPVTAWTSDGKVMTHNPFYVEAAADGLRWYFLPEDDTSRLFVYTVDLD